MAKYRIDILRTEYFRNAVVVEAYNLDDAIAKVEKEWNESDYLYEQTTDILWDASTEFLKGGIAKEQDIKNLTNIE